jgi:hypothetical protein
MTEAAIVSILGALLVVLPLLAATACEEWRYRHQDNQDSARGADGDGAARTTTGRV